MVTSCSVTAALPLAISTGYSLEILHAMNRHFKIPRNHQTFSRVVPKKSQCSGGTVTLASVLTSTNGTHPPLLSITGRSTSVFGRHVVHGWSQKFPEVLQSPTIFRTVSWLKPTKMKHYEGLKDMCLSSKGRFFRYMLSFT